MISTSFAGLLSVLRMKLNLKNAVDVLDALEC